MFKVTGCVSIATFASLACVPVGITSSVIRRKFVQSLHELKSVSQSERKRGKIMRK